MRALRLRVEDVGIALELRGDALDTGAGVDLHDLERRHGQRALELRSDLCTRLGALLRVRATAVPHDHLTRDELAGQDLLAAGLHACAARHCRFEGSLRRRSRDAERLALEEDDAAERSDEPGSESPPHTG